MQELLTGYVLFRVVEEVIKSIYRWLKRNSKTQK